METDFPVWRAYMAVAAAWAFAQSIKVVRNVFLRRRFNVRWIIDTGGMPSSHSSLITATTFAIGLYHGFDNPLFALGVAITMIVTYDAAGVRQQAGIHAQRINVLFDELLHGHPINQKDLREVIGHTPLEVVGGITLGLIVATAQWMAWR